MRIRFRVRLDLDFYQAADDTHADDLCNGGLYLGEVAQRYPEAVSERVVLSETFV